MPSHPLSQVHVTQPPPISNMLHLCHGASSCPWPHLPCLPHFPTCGCTCQCLPHFPTCAHLPSCTCLTLALVSVQLLVAMHLTSSCTQRSPQLWAFSDTGTVNSSKGHSEDSRSTPTCLNCGLWPTGCRYGCMWVWVWVKTQRQADAPTATNFCNCTTLVCQSFSCLDQWFYLVHLLALI